jgi:hypothetical protein
MLLMAMKQSGSRDYLEQHLLYIFFITPWRITSEKYVTTLSHWNTEKGVLTVSIAWNRQTDTVTIGKQEFIRENGNVFIVRLNADGEVSGQQLASLGAHISYQDVLQYAHQQMPNDELISSVRLYK